MKNIKKLTAFVASFVLAVGAIPTNIYASDVYDYKSVCDWNNSGSITHIDGYYLINYMEYIENRPITDFSMYEINIENYIKSEGGIEEINNKRDLNDDGVIDKRDFVIFGQLSRDYADYFSYHLVNGDVNQDGRVDAVDGYMLKYYFEDLENGNEDCYSDTQISLFNYRGDANEDGVVDITDADFILNGGYAEKLNSYVIHDNEEYVAYREAYINDTSSDLGDVDRDGSITRNDGIMILVYMLKLGSDQYDEYTEEEHEIFRKYGDVFSDGKINIFDASLVLAKASKNADESNITLDNTSSVSFMSDETAQTIEIGDVNHDGFVDARDATMVSAFYADCATNNIDKFTDEEKANFYTYGDMNKDGYVNSIDASLISAKYAELSTQ